MYEFPATPRLNIGCGPYPWEGWVNIDLADAPAGARPDMIASIMDLPFDDGSVSHIYLGHLLEHLHLHEVPAALRECWRVLRDDGEIMVVGPDLDRAEKFARDMIPAIWPGAATEGPGGHKWPSTEAETVRLLIEAGFHVVPIPVGTVPNYWPCPNRIGWQFACAVRKPVAVKAAAAA